MKYKEANPPVLSEMEFVSKLNEDVTKGKKTQKEADKILNDFYNFEE